MSTLSVKEAANRAGVSAITIRRAIKSGELKAKLEPGTYGHEYRIEHSALEEWIRERMGSEYTHAYKHKQGCEYTDQGVELVPAPLYQELQQQYKDIIFAYGAVKNKAEMLESDKEQLLSENKKLKEVVIDAAKREGELEAVKAERDALKSKVEELEKKLSELAETQGQVKAITNERDFLRAQWATLTVAQQKKGLFARLFSRKKDI
jgi:excisionase family DNA binding protein